jgi:hypothetical protein
MSISPMGANKPIEDIEATLLAATKSALDELVWWAHARRWQRRPLKRCEARIERIERKMTGRRRHGLISGSGPSHHFAAMRKLIATGA